MKGIVSLLVLGGAGLMAQSSTGSIQGIVSDATGAMLGGTYVTARLRGLPPLAQTVKSAADGTFLITALSPGTYSVCVQSPGGGFLDPCDWAATPPSVTLAAGQKSVGNNIKLKAGSILKVRLLDPTQSLGQKNKEGKDPHLMVGVWHRGSFHPVHGAGKDSAGADFQLTVPRDSLLTLAVTSKDLALGDTGGAALAGNSASQQFQHDSGDPNPKSFVFKINGKQP